MGSTGKAWVLCLAIASLGCATLEGHPAASGWAPDAERDAAVMAVLDRYVDGLNALRQPHQIWCPDRDEALNRPTKKPPLRAAG